MPWPLYFCKMRPPVPTEMEAECTPEPVWMFWWKDTSCPAGKWTSLYPSHYTNYAFPAPFAGGRTTLRGGADKFYARPGRKQATATKLGIYSTYFSRSSINILARCSNFCQPLKKKIQNVVRPTRSPRQQWSQRRTKNCELSMVFFQSREQVVFRRGQIRRIGWVIKTLEAQVGQFLLG